MDSRQISIIGFPMDLGAGRRGVDMGPSALRIARVAGQLEELGHEVHDDGDISIAGPESEKIPHPNHRYMPEIARACGKLATWYKRTLDNGHFPIALGGDHSMAIGSVAGVAAHCRENGKSLGVLWVDAHADINTPETTPSGNIHGMPIAVCLGRGPAELVNISFEGPKLETRNLSYIGLRSVDPGEARAIHELEIEYYAMPDIDRQGVPAIIDRVLERLSSQVDHLHVSFDMDAIDPRIAPGVGTPVFGGLTYREAHLVMETVAQCSKFCSLELVEVNPVLDSVNRTAELGAELIASALGKRIL
ncbi:MAG: arginase [Planctomycetales bacterium]|nr:arginase [bacterium]UNM06895.1 MAG: arginase [Planctomycetales bacterium]